MYVFYSPLREQIIFLSAVHLYYWLQGKSWPFYSRFKQTILNRSKSVDFRIQKC